MIESYSLIILIALPFIGLGAMAFGIYTIVSPFVG